MGFLLSIFQNTNGAAKIVENASQVTSVAWDSVNGLLTSLVARLPYILAGLLVLGLFYLLAQITRMIFWSASKRTHLDYRLRILVARLLVFAIVTLGVLTALTVIIPAFTFASLITGLGVTSFVIGFATKDILNNLLSGMMILWQQPFKLGDHIFVGSNQGKVEYIGVRATSLRKDDGELVLIPNGDMYNSALTIRGAGAARRMNIKLVVDYDADLEKAKAVSLQALTNHPRIKAEPKSSALVTDLNADGVTITMNFWIDTNEAKPQEVFDEAVIAVLEALKNEGIEIYNVTLPWEAISTPAQAPEVKEKVSEL